MPYQSSPMATARPVGDAERVEQEGEQAFPHAEAADGDGDDLGHRHRGNVREDRRVRHPARRRRGTRSTPTRPRRPGTRGPRGARSRRPWRSRRRRSTPMCTAPIARIQLSCSAKRPAAFGWPARNTITARNTTVPPAMSSASELRGSSNRLGIDREPGEHQDRQRDEAGEPLEHHRGEGLGGVAGVGRGAADPQDVAADRRRQQVPDELPGEVVLGQGAQPDVVTEHREHPLPAPRREHEAQAHQHDAGGEERPGAAGVVARDEVVEVDLREQDREEPGAHRASRSPRRRPVAAPCSGPVPQPPCAVDYEPSTPGRRSPRSSRVRGRRPCGSRSTTGSSSRSRSGAPVRRSVCVHGFGGAKEDFADHVDDLAARATVVTLDLRGHGDSGGPDRPRGATRSTASPTTCSAVADASALDRFRLLGPLDGRDGGAAGRARRARPGRGGRVHEHRGRAAPRARPRPRRPRRAARDRRLRRAEGESSTRPGRPRHRPRTSGCSPSAPGFREFGDVEVVARRAGDVGRARRRRSPVRPTTSTGDVRRLGVPGARDGRRARRGVLRRVARRGRRRFRGAGWR